MPQEARGGAYRRSMSKTSEVWKCTRTPVLGLIENSEISDGETW
jgi:hypothetical protein